MILKINNISINEIISIVDFTIKNKKKIKIFYINQNVFDLSFKNNKLLEIFNNGYLIPDGIAFFTALKLKNLTSKIYRHISTNIWEAIIKHAIEKNYSTFFFGGHAQVKKLKILRERFKGLLINGVINGYNIDIKDAVDLINKFDTDILFVGLGTPIQEYFISNYSESLNVKVIIAVGSAIDFFTNYTKRAPLWMQKIGLEWFFRLLIEPRRLWKRYLIGIPVFVFKILFLKVKLTLKKE